MPGRRPAGHGTSAALHSILFDPREHPDDAFNAAAFGPSVPAIARRASRPDIAHLRLQKHYGRSECDLIQRTDPGRRAARENHVC